MSESIIKNAVARLYVLRALDIVGLLLIAISLALWPKGAAVCCSGFVFWLIANQRSQLRSGIWSRQTLKLARISERFRGQKKR